MTRPELISLVAATLLSAGHAFAPPGAVAPRAASSSSSSSPSCLSMSAGIFFATIGGNTERCANYIGAACGVEPVAIEAVSSPADVSKHDSIIVGAPTWNTGADVQRSMTAWDEWLYEELPKLDLKGKKLAIFGVGDQMGYTFNFCDAVGELHDTFAARGIDASYGRTSTDGYVATETKATVEGEGKFYGCLFDEDNQSDMSEDRAKRWVAQLKEEGFF